MSETVNPEDIGILRSHIEHALFHCRQDEAEHAVRNLEAALPYLPGRCARCRTTVPAGENSCLRCRRETMAGRSLAQATMLMCLEKCEFGNEIYEQCRQDAIAELLRAFEETP